MSNSQSFDGPFTPSRRNIIYNVLMNDPEKRAKVLDLLTQNGMINNENASPNPKQKSSRRMSNNYKPMNQKVRMESPSALCRRRALENLENGESPSRLVPRARIVPHDILLNGVVAYCEVHSATGDRSESIKSMMRSMGATTRDKLGTDVTHVVYKDGSIRTVEKAKLLNIPIVSVLWVDAVRKNRYRVPEENYAPVGIETSLICSVLQKDFDEIIEDEIRQSIGIYRNQSNGAEIIRKSVVINSQKEIIEDDEITAQMRLLHESPSSNMDAGKDDFVPCSQDGRTSLSNTHHTNHSLHKRAQKTSSSLMTMTPPVMNDTTENCAQNVRDSIELKRALRIRSPESLAQRELIRNGDGSGEKVDISLNLHITTSDESGLTTEARDLVKNSSLPSTTVSDVSNKRQSTKSDDLLAENQVIGRRKGSKMIKLMHPAEDITNFAKPKNRKVSRSISSSNHSKENQSQSLGRSKRSLSVGNETKPDSDLTDCNDLIIEPTEEQDPEPQKKRVRKLYNEDNVSDSFIINCTKPPDDSGPVSNEIQIYNKKQKKIQIPLDPLDPTKSKKTHKNKSNHKDDKSSTSSSPERGKIGKKLVFKDINVTKRRKNVRKSLFSDSDAEDAPPKLLTQTTPQAKTPHTPPKQSKVDVDGPNVAIASTPKGPKVIPPSVVRRSTRKSIKPKFYDFKSPPKRNNKCSETTAIPTPVIESSTVEKRRSTLEFAKRTARKTIAQIKLTQTQEKRSVKMCSIVCTRLHRPDVLAFEQIVNKLGGFQYEEEVTERTTHLVAGEPYRTINMLRAIARGCWILRHEWVFRSLEAGRWLPEEEFEVTDFSPTVQKCRLERQNFGKLFSMNVFNGLGEIYVGRSCTPRFSDLEELVILCGGKCVANRRQATISVGEYYQDKNVCVSEKWILDCITENKKKSFTPYRLSGTN